MDFASQNLTAGQLNAVVKKLGGEEGVKKFLQGLSEVVVKTHVIDCNADPHVPENWKVEEHIKGGELTWNPEKITLYLSDKQKGGVIEGNKLRKELKGKPVLNANVLDYLLKNPHLIPDEWKGKYIFFWGTIYRRSGGSLYVRCLCWGGGSWGWSYRWLVRDWGGGSPAAVLAE